MLLVFLWFHLWLWFDGSAIHLDFGSLYAQVVATRLPYACPQLTDFPGKISLDVLVQYHFSFQC